MNYIFQKSSITVPHKVNRIYLIDATSKDYFVRLSVRLLYLTWQCSLAESSDTGVGHWDLPLPNLVHHQIPPSPRIWGWCQKRPNLESSETDNLAREAAHGLLILVYWQLVEPLFQNGHISSCPFVSLYIIFCIFLFIHLSIYQIIQLPTCSGGVWCCCRKIISPSCIFCI